MLGPHKKVEVFGMPDNAGVMAKRIGAAQKKGNLFILKELEGMAVELKRIGIEFFQCGRGALHDKLKCELGAGQHDAKQVPQGTIFAS